MKRLRQLVLMLQEEQFNRFASFCQMVSNLFGFTELFPSLSELLLRLMSAVSAGGSSEGEEQRATFCLSEESIEKQMQKIMGSFCCLALGWEQGECDVFPSLC